jgi:integrase
VLFDPEMAALTATVSDLKAMRNGSKQIVYEVYGNYVEGVEKDGGSVLEYFGNDFISL